MLITVGVGDRTDADLVLRVGAFEEAFANIEAKVINGANIAITLLAAFITVLHCFYLLFSIDCQFFNHSLINLQLRLNALSWLVDFQSTRLTNFANFWALSLLTFVHGQLLFQFEITLCQVAVLDHFAGSRPPFSSSLLIIGVILGHSRGLIHECLL